MLDRIDCLRGDIRRALDQACSQLRLLLYLRQHLAVARAVQTNKVLDLLWLQLEARGRMGRFGANIGVQVAKLSAR